MRGEAVRMEKQQRLLFPCDLNQRYLSPGVSGELPAELRCEVPGCFRATGRLRKPGGYPAARKAGDLYRRRIPPETNSQGASYPPIDHAEGACVMLSRLDGSIGRIETIPP